MHCLLNASLSRGQSTVLLESIACCACYLLISIRVRLPPDGSPLPINEWTLCVSPATVADGEQILCVLMGCRGSFLSPTPCTPNTLHSATYVCCCDAFQAFYVCTLPLTSRGRSGIAGEPLVLLVLLLQLLQQHRCAAVQQQQRQQHWLLGLDSILSCGCCAALSQLVLVCAGQFLKI